MQNLVKQFIYTRITPPNNLNDLLEFVEDNYKQRKITLFEYGRQIALLNHYGLGGLDPLEIKSTINCMICNKETPIEEIENKLCPNCKDVAEFTNYVYPFYKLEKIERKLNKNQVTG